MKVKIVTSVDDLPEFSPGPVFCDIETQGLYVDTRLIQFYQPTTDDTIYILDMAPINYDKSQYETNLQQAKDLLLSLHTVGYSYSYDLGTLNISPEKFDDLFYAVKTAYYTFQEYSLDKVIDKLGYSNYYAGLDKKKLQKQGFVLGAYLSQSQIKYSAIDVLVLSKIWEDEKVQDVINSNMAYKVDILSQKYALVYQQNGLVVDHKMREEKLQAEKEVIDKLEPILPTGFNPNSYKQVRALLDTDKSDHEALIKMALDKSNPQRALYAQTIIDIKRAKKGYSYLESLAFPKMVTKFNVAGAITGRFTSKGGDIPNGFNAQQIPRPYQQIFLQDTDDTTVVHLDYSTLELRLACTIFNEPEMYKQLKNGEDLHTAMAITATGKPLHKDGPLGSDYEAIGVIDTTSKYITKKDRQDAKSINFGFVFGMSAKRYVEYAYTQFGITISLEKAVELREKYFSKYKGIKAYHDYVWSNYQKPDFHYTTALGRKVKPKMGTDGINGPVQGTGGETTKLAVHYLVKDYPEALGLIFNVVHDAIYLRVPKADKQIWKERVAKAMVKGWEEISKTKLFAYKDIPMPVE